MILSFIEIEDIKSGLQEIKDTEMSDPLETGQKTDWLSIEKKNESHEKDINPIADNPVSAYNPETNTQKEETYSQGQLFGDTFELRYLQHKEKIEKERFARELLTGKN